jgi:hypothetical protein
MEKVMKVRKVRVQEDDAWRKPRVYFSIKSESLFENLENRWSRPYKGYRTLLPEVFKKADIPQGTKASWRQTAGCSCGCSPAFILDLTAPEYMGKEIFVEIA